MTDKIIEQKPLLWTIYSTTTPGPAVPYPAVDKGAAGRNYGFFNLRENLALVETVPEAVGHPGLQAVLRAANDPASVLMTLGCENYLRELEAPIGDATWCHSSYVDLAYADPARGADEQNLIDLARFIVKGMDLQLSYWTGLELGVQPTRGYFGYACYDLQVVLSGYGRDANSATRVWDAQCLRLASVLKAAR